MRARHRIGAPLLAAAWLLACLAGAQTPHSAPAQPARTHSTRRMRAQAHSASASSSAAQSVSAEPDLHVNAGRFGIVTLYIPDATPRSVAIFLSGDGGWEPRVVKMAHVLMDEGAVVIGVDIRKYLASVAAAGMRRHHPHCQMIAADLETLSHGIQREIGLEHYHVPVLVGYSSGASVVYVALAESPPGTFAGAMSLGFCPEQDFGGALICPGEDFHYHHSREKGEWTDLIFKPSQHLRQPWVAFQGQQDQVCLASDVDAFAAQTPLSRVVRLPKVGHGFAVARNWVPQFRSTYLSLVPQVVRPAERPRQISDLPLDEVPAKGGTSDELAVLLTGDGGWAGLDQEVAARLAASSVPTVALNSLKYFWEQRSPQEAADAVARIMRHYLAAWHKQRVLLVGYSFGADVLPFIVNRLPQDLRSRVATLNLLGIDTNASFKITIGDWLGTDTTGPPTLPELQSVHHLPVLCIYGQGEQDSICPGLPAPRFKPEQIGKGHHFSGDYAQLAERILAFAHTPRPRA